MAAQTREAGYPPGRGWLACTASKLPGGCARIGRSIHVLVFWPRRAVYGLPNNQCGAVVMEGKLPVELHQQFERFTEQLVEEFGDQGVPAEEVKLRAHRKLDEFKDARVLNFLPLLVYRYTRDDLT